MPPTTIRTSIFVDPSITDIEGAAEINTNRIELYTESYASFYAIDHSKAIESFVEAAKFAGNLGVDVNAGHDLSLENLNYICQRGTGIKEAPKFLKHFNYDELTLNQ